ncbi:MAG: BTAD domain-containing putative transcriptional regulator [Actinomycetales bacterium]
MGAQAQGRPVDENPVHLEEHLEPRLGERATCPDPAGIGDPSVGDPARDEPHHLEGDGEAYAVLLGPRGQRPTAESASGFQVAWSAGDAVAVHCLRTWHLAPDDELVELAAEEPNTSQSAWIVVRRRRSASTGRILVVDDDDAVRDYYTEALQSVGHIVAGAATAGQAVDLLNASAFDVVLLDIRLPDANGFELCRQVIGLPSGRNTRILLMSADPELADNTRVLAAGADGFLLNPVLPPRLRQAVDRALQRKVSDLGTAVQSTAGRSTGVQLRFFGTAAIKVGDGHWTELPAGRSSDLLATLSAACPLAVTPARLTRFVWLEGSEVSHNAVYTAVSRLRTFLTDVGAGDLVTSDPHGYGLALDPAQIDLVAFELATKAVLRDPDRSSPDAVRAVLDLWRNEPFEGTNNTLLERWRSRLVETRARLLEILALNELRWGDPEAAAQTCAGLLADEPWRESIWALRIVALYRCGRSNDALGVLSESRRRLRDELGLDQGPALAGLAEQVLAHAPDLVNDEWLVARLRGSHRGGLGG